jgi:hypothetical protein
MPRRLVSPASPLHFFRAGGLEMSNQECDVETEVPVVHFVRDLPITRG